MLSYRIKRARIQKGWSQSELAENLGKTRTAVVNWETGYATPTESTIEDIAKLLDVEVEWLLDDSNDEFETIESTIEVGEELTFKQKVGLRLRYYRKKKGLNQLDVSNFLRMSHSAVSNYELGRSEPDLETLNTLGDLYGMSIDHLLGRSGNFKNDMNDIDKETWILDMLSSSEQKIAAMKKIWEEVKEL